MQKKNNIEINYKIYLSVKENGSDKWEKSFFLNFFSNKNTLFFLLKKSSKGYLIARRITDEYELILVETNKNKRRKGIASELMKMLLTKAKKRDIKKIFLEVSKNNIAAIELYKKFNFNYIGERKNYYKVIDGYEDAYTMVKLIN
ncbi:MAG: ribosomal protein S18-alanine N-acetyltransferase [Pseudomonadota bacterium]|nr:ribosomal protein S18-alanine N-acetyltransferase [Pseudomonadota bacterium]